MAEFSHFDAGGKAIMVDVSGKAHSKRQAIASGCIAMSSACYAMVKNGTAKKGDVLGTARIAGIMATKQTPGLIPLCHTLLLDKAELSFAFFDDECKIEARCTVACTGVTGVEMEALTGATIALLTIYDMCKAVDKAMMITAVHLVEKTGGKSGHYQHNM